MLSFASHFANSYPTTSRSEVAALSLRDAIAYIRFITPLSALYRECRNRFLSLLPLSCRALMPLPASRHYYYFISVIISFAIWVIISRAPFFMLLTVAEVALYATSFRVDWLRCWRQLTFDAISEFELRLALPVSFRFSRRWKYLLNVHIVSISLNSSVCLYIACHYSSCRHVAVRWE